MSEMPPPHVRSAGSGNAYWPTAAAILLMFFMAACSVTGWRIEPPPPARIDAEAAFARGEYAQAAAAWESEAAQSGPESAAALRVSAADAWLLAGDVAGAEGALRSVSRADLTPADTARLSLVLADLALRSGHPDEAHTLLLQAGGAVPEMSRDRYRDLEARLRQLAGRRESGDLGRAAQIGREMRVYNPAAAVELLRTLEPVRSGELASRANGPQVDPQSAGWFDLALVIRQNLVVPDRVVQAVTAWKLRHPDHLLAESEALDTWLRYREQFAPPGRTAVLLPASGRLLGAGEAIRDGLLSAYLADPGRGELLFFGTGDEPQSAIAAYFSALDAGADHIVGPLRKESVESLLGLPGLATPVLALNDLPEGFRPPPGLAGQLSGISLSQEAEVAAIADQAAASGYRRAIVLAPKSAWGERMVAVFEAEFLQGDRQIVAASRYRESENDHSGVLERTLKIDESRLRAQQLENTLQMTLEFEPVRRDDVDVIFLAAGPAQAKQIGPQLRFLDAGDIPVFATGRIYSGQPDPARNVDLDGVRFPITPWEAAHSDSDEIPDLSSLKGGAMGSLFALGQDAWNVLRWLPLLQKDPDFSFPGLSGIYRMNAGGGLDRRPAWAEFSSGRPVPVAAAPALPPASIPAGPLPVASDSPAAPGSR